MNPSGDYHRPVNHVKMFDELIHHVHMILIDSQVREKCRRSCSLLAFLSTFSLPLPCCLTQVHLQELFYQGLESKLTSHL